MAKIKELKKAQKEQFVKLADDYRAISKNFIYTGYDRQNDGTRNMYAGDLETATRNGKFRLNCATFAQFLLMGRSAEDFSRLDRYNNRITKAFKWGYYFQFPHRRVYRAVSCLETRSSALMKNVSWPNNADPGSNSYDSATWTRATFSLAGDMAFELWALGCEIPFGEVQIGDIAFVSDRNWVDRGNLRMSFRNISHVMICVGISTTADGFDHPIWIDSSQETVIGRHTTGGGYTVPAMALSAQYELNIVMCARNPAALGFGGNVPEKIAEV